RLVASRAAFGRGQQGAHAAGCLPRIHSRERAQVRPARSPEGPRARSALIRPAESAPAETICNEARPAGNSPETIPRENRGVVSKQERKMIAPHGVKFMLLAAGLLVAGSVWAQA